jgi:hypothetical protein
MLGSQLTPVVEVRQKRAQGMQAGASMDVGGTAWIMALMLAAVALGFLLARLNVFALVLASALLMAVFMFYLAQHATLLHSILLSLANAFIVQIGYLLGQFLQKPPE